MKHYFAMLLLAFALVPALAVNPALAQTDTTTTAADGPQNTVQIFFVGCENQAVVNLSGLMLTGYDIYYQAFAGAGGTGATLTGLRRVSVDGNYAYSEAVAYAGGLTVPTGAVSSLRVVIAFEGAPNATSFETTVDDVQDGCSNPQNAPGTSTDLGGGGVDPNAAPQRPVQPDILTPGGGVLNPNRVVEDQVQVGARQSDFYRSETPGLIFAECDEYPESAPGLVYDSDTVTVFWSWFADDLDQINAHLANANYSVRMNTAGMPNPVVSTPQEINGDQWIFYSVWVGNLKPGHYEIEFRLTWDQPISDGYEDYGPGTQNELIASQCNFDVQRNNAVNDIYYTTMYNPTAYPVHNLNPGLQGGEQGLGVDDQINLELGQPLQSSDD